MKVRGSYLPSLCLSEFAGAGCCVWREKIRHWQCDRPRSCDFIWVCGLITKHTATQCNTLQRTAVHCNAWWRHDGVLLYWCVTHCVAVCVRLYGVVTWWFEHTAAHCSTIQQTAKHVASHCNTLQHSVIHSAIMSRYMHMLIATHCNIHRNTHFNTLQHGVLLSFDISYTLWRCATWCQHYCVYTCQTQTQKQT